ncbi:MAG: glycine cleavage system protein T [Chloroflexi bacterium]|nr:glycine cleavage system protein T [Chloroflexota bacterium]
MLIFNLSETFSRIRVCGANRVDFLHRMSTGDLLGIQPGEGRRTVFTTPIGRMVDYALVLAFEDSLLMLGGTGRDRLVRWLRKYVFFNDDVQLVGEDEALPLWGIYGEGADDFAEGLSAGASQMTRDAHRMVGDAVLVGAPPLQGSGYYLLGSSLPVTKLQAPISQYEDLRIQAGYPAVPNEISGDYIPLEAGLIGAISFDKGCYIGQEIIARMESRGQLAKRLARIEAVSEGVMKPGDALRVNADAAGVLTSVTSDGRVALGYVRAPYAHEGQVLTVGDGEHTARVIGFAAL